MKPMLAATAVTLEEINLPVIASPKLDGIRAMVMHGQLVSRNLKAIPNTHLQNSFGRMELNGLDGELILGDPTSPTVFRDSLSAVMSKAGKPLVSFHIFDHFLKPSSEFQFRRARAVKTVQDFNGTYLEMVPQTLIKSLSDLISFEQEMVDLGYEGIMTRNNLEPYKFGRATMKSQGLVKVKRFLDAKARIIGFEEQMQNLNMATLDKLGQTKRSSHKAHMVGKRTLGALQVEGLEKPWKGIKFSVGSGMDGIMQTHIWHQRDKFLGKVIIFKYFPVGCKDAPRHPVFLRFEDFHE